jgi:glycosyltransferase involved in cell wall biosynthesis
MSATRWVLISGEYPPEPGGVSDYSRLVARGLAVAGDEVHVWAPASSTSIPTDPGVTVHALTGKFGPRDLEMLDRGLSRVAKPYRLLVQYVPHAFGCKGMNVPFCWWLNRRVEPVWVMFNEVVYPLSTRQPMSHNFLGVVTRLMATLVARKAERIFVSIPAWEEFLPQSSRRRIAWLPVPSNIATTVCAADVEAVRGRVAPNGEVILGHFGTYGSHVGSLLARILPALLLAKSRRIALLIGKGSDAFAASLLADSPALCSRVLATGPLAQEQLATHLAACDCLVQPYPDGVSSRRGSLMAGLALGLPIVTNAGPLTDAIWKECEAVALAPSVDDITDAVEQLLAEPCGMRELSRGAAELYQKRFDLSRTIDTLRSGIRDNVVAA